MTSADMAYILKGYGDIEPAWLGRCLQLFKEDRINIRKLVLLKDGSPSCFGMMEIHFMLAQPEAFLERLEAHLDRQAWRDKTLTRI